MRLLSLQKHYQKGLTLVELMIAMGLGLLISAAAMQAFLVSNQTRRTEQALTQLQDSGRTGLQIIGDDIKRAANFGPSTPVYNPSSNSSASFTDYIEDKIIVIAKDNTADLDKTRIGEAIKGYRKNDNGTWIPALPATLTGTDNVSSKARNESDVLTIFYANPLENTKLASEYSGNNFSNNTAISLASNTDCIKNGELIILSNVQTLHIIRVTNSPACGSTATTLEFESGASNETGEASVFSYDTESTVLMRFHQATYYVGITNRNDANNQPIYALYRKLNGAAAEEILEGVEYLRMEYGEKLNNGNIRFVTADETPVSNHVVLARIGILVSDSTIVTTKNDTHNYILPGATISSSTAPKHSGGKVLRKAFISTYAVNSRSW